MTLLINFKSISLSVHSLIFSFSLSLFFFFFLFHTANMGTHNSFFTHRVIKGIWKKSNKKVQDLLWHNKMFFLPRRALSLAVMSFTMEGLLSALFPAVLQVPRGVLSPQWHSVNIRWWMKNSLNLVGKTRLLAYVFWQVRLFCCCWMFRRETVCRV